MKTETNLSIQSERRMAKLTGICNPDPSYLSIFYWLIPGIIIGFFLAIVLIKPELINWQVFGQSFLIGVMMGVR